MRTFNLADVLSITTGVLLSDRLIEGVYDILGYMTNDPYITTLGLVAVADASKDELLRQHPQLAVIEVPEFNVRKDGTGPMLEWIESQVAIYGDAFEVKPFGSDFERENDFEVITRVRGSLDNVVVVAVDND